MAEPLSTFFRPLRGPIMPAFERLASPPPEHLVAAEIESRTAPGDIVIELHGRGAWVARSALDRLRRVYDIESTGLTSLQAELVLRPPDVRHLDAALNALAIQPRGDVGLRKALLEPFTSRCATCQQPVIVEEFVWAGEGAAPSHKTYRCDVCGGRGRSSVGLTVPVDDRDVRVARDMGRGSTGAREYLRARFPTPEPGHGLPGQLLDLYTPRTVEALAALVERLDADLRAAPIQAALRLALAHVLLPASRLNRYPGRAAILRIHAGRLRVPSDHSWRERNPWLLFEDGVRLVRAFIQRMEGVPGGSIQARLGNDLASLIDGAANVVLRQGSAAVPGVGPTMPAHRPRLPGRLDPRSRVRLVLTQPPVHWSPDNLAFAYLATSMVLGSDEAKALPLDAVFGAPPNSEWGWDVASLRRSLTAVRPALAPEGRAVVILDDTGPAGLSAALLGGVGAGFRLSGALLAETGETIAGTLEFATPEAMALDPTSAAGGSSFPASQRGGPLAAAAGHGGASVSAAEGFQLSVVEDAVTDVAVATLQLRGEPARFERLLGEVLIGLDRLGHLGRLIGTRTFAETEERAERAAEAVGLFGELGATRPASRPAATAPTLEELVPLAARIERVNGSVAASPREHGAPLRGLAGQVSTPVAAEATAPESGRQPAPVEVSDPEDAPETGPRVTADIDSWERSGSGSDPAKLLLEIVLGELRRPDHARLIELEPGRWWLRDERDIAAARLPLSDRLEWSVFSLLSTSGGLSEEAFRDRVAGMMRGHDTPDDVLVRACLESYRSADSTPELIRTDDSLRARYEEHGVLVGMLAEYGERLGFRRWIATREQKRSFKGRPLASLLSDVEERVYLPLVTPGDAEALEQVDCIWYVRGKAAFLFEVEWTAMLAEPVLRRGARIPTVGSLVRFLVIPPERTELIRLKLERSPLLRTAIEEGNWHILKSDHLRRLYAREEADLEDLGPLLGLDPEIEHQGEQLALFG